MASARKGSKPTQPNARARSSSAEKLRGGRGNKAPLNADKVIEAAEATGAIRSAMAKMLNVSRKALGRYLEDHPTVCEAVDDIKEVVLDLAETKLIQAIRDGDGQMIRFYLETQGKHRGYTRRVETTGKDGGPVETVTASERNQALKNIPTDQLRALAEAAANANNGGQDGKASGVRRPAG